MPSKDDKAPLSADDILREDDVLDDLDEAIAAEAAPEYEEGVDPNHPVLTVAEQREALQKARDKIAASQRKKAMDALVDKEMQRLQGESGLVTGDAAKDELVTVSLDLAEHADGITLNGRKYFHGATYTVPRHVADFLREVQARGWNHQNELEGKGIADRFRRPRMSVISGKSGAVANAPQGIV